MDEINIKLNDYTYRYDIYHIFNIYYNLKKINFSNESGDFKINVDEEKITYEYLDRYAEEKFNNYEKPKETIKKLLFRELKTLTGDNYPWGTLIGIRPSKIALLHLKEGKTEEEIQDIFYQKHYTDKEKSQICIDVAKVEEKYVNTDKNYVSIYIGMAFCPTRCLYCSFASNPIEANRRTLVRPYLDALKYEIDAIKNYINDKKINVETVYFGGGTPTSVNEAEFEEIMEVIYNSFIKNRDVKEFTVECGRPDSLSDKKFEIMKNYEVNRISINPQTMNDETLKLIGRNHTAQDIIEKFNMAKKYNFNHINMDIIIGLPGEGYKEAQHTMEEIKKLGPDSITVHGLSLKRGSIMFDNFILKKGLGIKEQSEIEKMYEASKALARNLGLHPYYMYRQRNMVGNMENLGYTKGDKVCLYNIEMIEDKQTIIALGADAVTKVVFLEENRIERFGNVKDVREYVNRIQELVESKISLLNTLYK